MKCDGESSTYIHKSCGMKRVGASTLFFGLRGKLCGCGERVMLLQANMTKNKCRIFENVGTTE